MNKKLIGILFLTIVSIGIDKAIQGNLMRVKKIMEKKSPNTDSNLEQKGIQNA